MLLAMVGLAIGCEKSTPTTPSGTTYTVTITGAGVNPKSLDVPLGARVMFVNNDTQARYMHSNPHPDATDCPALNQIGLLPAGQKRETACTEIGQRCSAARRGVDVFAFSHDRRVCHRRIRP